MLALETRASIPATRVPFAIVVSPIYELSPLMVSDPVPTFLRLNSLEPPATVGAAPDEYRATISPLKTESVLRAPISIKYDAFAPCDPIRPLPLSSPILVTLPNVLFVTLNATFWSLLIPMGLPDDDSRTSFAFVRFRLWAPVP